MNISHERISAEVCRTTSCSGLPATTLILPTVDRPQMARHAVESVLAGDVVPDELLVIDQSARPMPLDDIVDHGGCEIRVIRARRGLSHAVNVGVRGASHDVVVFTHDDVEVDRHWLRVLVLALERMGPGGVVTGRVGATDPESKGAFAPALRDDPDRVSHVGRVGAGMLRPMNLAMHRSTFEAVGGYDERLGPGTHFPGAEDHDLCLRVLEAGHTLDYEPDALVRHRAWRTSQQYLPLRWRYGVAHGAYYAKHFDRTDPFVLGQVRADVGRRARQFPRRLRREGARAFGDPLFLLGNVVGAASWRRRYADVAETSITARRAVAPVAPDADRPKWSVMIPAYECPGFLAETVASVVAQLADSDAQIEVVDDASVADLGEVVRRVGGGRVGHHREPVNQGNVANFDVCLGRSRGHLIHILHGDDLVMPGFYDTLGRALDDNPDCVAAFCRHDVIDELGDLVVRPRPLRERAGVFDDLFGALLCGQLLQPPAVVVRRNVYEALGGFDRRIERYGEDWEMWTRIAAHGPVWYTPEVLAEYRVRSGSISHSSVGTGEHLADLRRGVAINRETSAGLLPSRRADQLARSAHRSHGLAAVRRSLRAADDGDYGSATRQATSAVRSTRSPVVLGAAVLVPGRVVARRQRDRLSRQGDGR